LEAAHVDPADGVDTYKTENGLTLRSDLHDLFDDFQWTLVALSGTSERSSYVVILSKEMLKDPDYRHLHGRWLRLENVDRAALQRHHDKFIAKQLW
jgi:hypothetical protein